MYPVSATFKDRIQYLDQDLRVSIQIQHSGGTLSLDDSHLAAGGLWLEEASQGGDDFTVGGKSASELCFEFFNQEAYEDIEFVGATVLASVALVLNLGEVDEEGDPVEPVLEWVPLGVFNVDEVTRTKTSSTVSISAFDNLILFDKPYSLSELSYPATLSQIFTDLCNVCDVLPESVVFTNSAYQVATRPDDDLTCRDILGYVAELAGCFARATRAGKVELAWYEASGLTLTGANRYSFTPRDDVVQITGVMATVSGEEGDVTYLAGTDTYAIDLSDNPLLQSNHETAIAAVYNAVKDTAFHPYASGWQGNPAVQAGDIITQVDRDGNEYPTLVTHSTYKYRGESTLEARGLPVTAKGFKGSTNKKIASIVRKVEAALGDRLSSLEQATLHATELIANMLGGHVIVAEDAIYICDAETLEASTKIWKWGAGGFGYSDDGGETYGTAITADGTIVAALVAAGLVTADMVQAGILQSQTGSTSINLNTGLVNIQNKVYFDPTKGEYIFDGLLSAKAINALKGEIDVVVSYTTITQVLAAEKGNISELTVDQLDTSDMVQRYLDSDTSNVNFIRIYGQNFEIIEATVKDGAPTAQLLDRKQRPLYWLDAERTGVTLDVTPYPVTVYQYDIENRKKLTIDFEVDPNTGNAIPRMVWGAGDENDRAKGYIIKDETGLRFKYHKADDSWVELVLGENGIEGTNASLTDLDIYSDGMISEYDDGTVYDWSWTKDGSGRITEITNNTTQKSATISWNAGAKP